MNSVKRRDLLMNSAALGIVAAVSPKFARSGAPGTAPAAASSVSSPLRPPAEGSIPVAFLISDGAVIIDFCGPWEVFQDARIAGRKDSLFTTYTVAETTKPIRASGGMTITPNFSYDSAPLPKVLVIPAQSTRSEASLAWIRKVAQTADVTMSVCNGAYLLAQTGLLAGKVATLHHGSYGNFASQFPDVHVRRGARFVEAGNLASSGGLSSGMDLAFRVVERYFGRDLATQTAFDMEYQGKGWLNPDSNSIYTQKYVSTANHPVCVVCGMQVNPKTDLTSVYKGTIYNFCGLAHKQQFDANPEDFVTSGVAIS
jgi:transcriptional regulator GlxA family with amidase domain